MVFILLFISPTFGETADGQSAHIYVFFQANRVSYDICPCKGDRFLFVKACRIRRRGSGCMITMTVRSWF